MPLTEADTCRKYVLPKLYAAGWTDDQISEQRTFTDGRIIVSGNKVLRRPQKRADYLLRYTRSRVRVRNGPIIQEPGNLAVLPSYESVAENPHGTPYFYLFGGGWGMRKSNLCVPFTVEVDGVVIHQENICSQ